MNKYDSLLGAARYAATLSNHWDFSTSDEKYDVNGLLTIAEISDAENPADEHSYYLVSPEGSIGFCEDGDYVDWLFLAPKVHTSFCSNCGNSLAQSDRFCGKCGNKRENA